MKRALDSVINQSYKNWEAIVIDNYSNDHTEKVINKFEDKRINFYKNHNNGIIAVSRNLGIKLAKGEWIAFLDSDDTWYKSRLDVIISEINSNNNIDVICSNEIMIYENSNKKKILRYGPFCKNFYKELLLIGNRLSTSATVVKKNFLLEKNLQFREDKNFVTVEDYDLWMRLANLGAKFKFLKSIQGNYHIHSDNYSSIAEINSKNSISVIRDHVFNIQKFNLNKNRLWKSIYSRILLIDSLNKIFKGNYLLGIKIFFYSIYNSPFGILRYFIGYLKIKICNIIY